MSRSGVRRASGYALLLVIVVSGRDSAAQWRETAPDVRITVGATRTYLDEPESLTVGGGVRLPITERLAFEPEILKVASDEFDGWQVNGNVFWEFGGSARMRPYAIGGLGVMQDRQKSIDYTSREISVSGGAGARLFVSERVYLAPEARLGSHHFPRLTVTLGVLVR